MDNEDLTKFQNLMTSLQDPEKVKQAEQIYCNLVQENIRQVIEFHFQNYFSNHVSRNMSLILLCNLCKLSPSFLQEDSSDFNQHVLHQINTLFQTSTYNNMKTISLIVQYVGSRLYAINQWETFPNDLIQLCVNEKVDG